MKLLITTSRHYMSVRNNTFFNYSKFWPRSSFSRPRKRRRRKRRSPSKSLGNVSLCSSCFRFLSAKRELHARFSLPPTPHPSLKIFAPLRCRLLTSLTFSNLHLAERIWKDRDISYTPLVSRSRYKQFRVVSKWFYGGSSFSRSLFSRFRKRRRPWSKFWLIENGVVFLHSSSV